MSKGLVYKATSDDQKAVSGFVLKELAQMSKNSVEDSQAIATALLERLTKESPDVRYKVLRALKYMCDNARAEFRIDLQRGNDIIRACLHFKGPLDPLRGDAPYHRVREAAKEAMAAIFNTSARPTSTTSVAGRIEGFGTDAPPEPEMGGATMPSPVHPAERVGGAAAAAAAHEWAATGAVPKIESGAYSTGRMVGFGNPAFAPAAPSVLDRMREAVVGKEPTPAFRPHGPPDGGYASPTSATAAPEPAPRYAETSTARQRGQVGGGWGTTPVEAVRAAPGAGAGASVAIAPATGGFGSSVSAVASVTEPRRAERRTGNGEHEGRLVDEITNPSGVRALPRPEELTAFVDKCRSLDTQLIASLLDVKLASGVFQTQLKALCVLETLLKADNEEVEEYVSTHPTNLETLERSTNSQLMNKALEILRLTGLREAAAAPPPRASPPRALPSGAPPPPPTATIAFSLFDEPAPAPAPAPVATSTAAPSWTVDTPAPAPSAFGFLEEPASGGGMFVGMDVSTAPTPAPAPVPVSAPLSFLDEAMAGLSVTPTPTPAPSMFPYTHTPTPTPATPPRTTAPSTRGAFVDPFDFSTRSGADPLNSLLGPSSSASSSSGTSSFTLQSSMRTAAAPSPSIGYSGPSPSYIPSRGGPGAASPYQQPGAYQPYGSASTAGVAATLFAQPTYPDLMGAPAPGTRHAPAPVASSATASPMTFRVVQASSTQRTQALGPLAGSGSASGSASSSGFSFMGDSKPADPFGSLLTDFTIRT